MDDPLFDPWGEDPESAGARAPAPAPRAPKWRSTSVPAPRAPARRPFPPRPPSAQRPRARLAGTPGFIRSMAAPRLEEIARRLTVARHEALVEDDLDAELPSLRLQVRPWRGPWEEDLGPSWEILELVLEGGPEDRVVARRWIDGAETPPEVLGSVPASRLAAAWLEAQALTFIAGALGRQ